MLSSDEKNLKNQLTKTCRCAKLAGFWLSLLSYKNILYLLPITIVTDKLQKFFWRHTIGITDFLYNLN